MSRPLTIAIDAMGGDDAPAITIEGLAMAAKDLPDATFLVFGDEQIMRPFLDKLSASVMARITVGHTPDVISNDAKPSQALRQGKASSMNMAIQAVKAGKAQGIISAGNTGALMAMAKLALRMLPGIDRPAIAAPLPNVKGEQSRTLMLDLGANTECTSDNLVQFALMGEVYARYVLDIPRPRVGILNIGEEELKGPEYLREAANALQDSALPLDYCGFVEGDDIFTGVADVIVSDGFSGNIALKTLEGTITSIKTMMKQAFTKTLLGRVCLLFALPFMLLIRKSIDPRRYNGALFLGLNGICVKSHGGTDAIGFANAVLTTASLITCGVNEGIREDYARQYDNAKQRKKETT